MLEMKVVKRGNSLSLQAPKEADFKLGEVYYLEGNKQNGFYIIPKVPDLFTKGEYGEWYTPDVWEDMAAVGLEVINDEYN